MISIEICACESLIVYNFNYFYFNFIYLVSNLIIYRLNQKKININLYLKCSFNN
jgi:hypothetical protein